MGDTSECQAGTYCRGRDEHGQPHQGSDPLCQACLDHAQPAVTALVYDYLDLAQLHEASMSQAVNEHTSGGGHESPTLLADHVEALQAEIVHVVSLWEHALRATGRLHNPRTFAPLWRTRVYDHLNLPEGGHTLRKARAGAIVQRAVSIIRPRLERLSRLPAATVCPTGIEDPPTPMHGWEAVLQLQALHHRARTTLGRTQRTFWIPGECWHCNTHPKQGIDGPLFRAEPRDADDPMQVTCSVCAAVRPYADYEQYQLTLLWPNAATDELVRVSA